LQRSKIRWFEKSRHFNKVKSEPAIKCDNRGEAALACVLDMAGST
jgi:hypothetical protein